MSWNTWKEVFAIKRRGKAPILIMRQHNKLSLETYTDNELTIDQAINLAESILHAFKK